MNRRVAFATQDAAEDRVSDLENLIEQARCEKALSFYGLQVRRECWQRKYLEVSKWCGICQLKRQAGL